MQKSRDAEETGRDIEELWKICYKRYMIKI